MSNQDHRNLRVLNQTDIDAFMQDGYVVLSNAFDPEDAKQARQLLWDTMEERFGIREDDPDTWNQPMVHLSETFRNEAFDRCNTTKLADAIEDLTGVGRQRQRHVYGESEQGQLPEWGWWPVNFSVGRDEPWNIPVYGWHWDGIHFRHTLDAPHQGLLVLCLFSDIGTQGGGTLVVRGSHRPVARMLQRYPDGVELREAGLRLQAEHPYFFRLTEPSESREERLRTFIEESWQDEDGSYLQVVETTGKPGDVILCHPFLIHAASPNTAGAPRFMCNRTTPLKENMQLVGREDEAAYSPLERSIRDALS